MTASLSATHGALMAAETISGGEIAAFWILGPLSVLGALGMVIARNAVHSALWLVLVMGSLGVFYVIQFGPVHRAGPDHRVHRRQHDAVPVRPFSTIPRTTDFPPVGQRPTLAPPRPL